MTEIAPHRLSATEAAGLINAGQLESEALVRSCLDRVARRDPAVRAWSALSPESALRAARQADKAPVGGALHGIPVAVKDVIHVRDLPTTYNSSIGFDRPMPYDAPCVETLRAAGAIIMGKTDTTEFAAAGRHAGARNPHELTRSPGGSSSGSAAAVADGQAPLALGTQTGGSLLRPASFCGIFACKPSWGVVSREDSKLYSATFDTIGWYGRCVADLCLLADVYGIEDDEAPRATGLAGRRIAVCDPFPALTETASHGALALAASILRAAGAEIVALPLPAPFATLNDVHKTILFSEGRAAFLNLHRAHHDRLHEDFRHRAENRDGISRATLRAAYDTAATCRIAFDELASGFDAVLAPSAPGEAVPGRHPGEAVLNQIWSLLHTPAVGVPGFRGPLGLPVGITLTGPRFTDRRVLMVAGEVADAFAAGGHVTGIPALD